jgi:urea carboxylase
MMFSKVLVANRGEIACRIIRTLDRLNITSVAVFSDADRYAPHSVTATQAVHIGASPPAQSYLDHARILQAARETGAEAIHPGYGFLSENADFAEACAAAGIVFIGPTPDQIRLFGLKHHARAAARQAGVALAPGSDLVASLQHALAEAARIGYPVMLKGTAGGGGIGLHICRDEASLRDHFESAQRLSARSFGHAGVFLESYIEDGRHIEVQIFGDGKGQVLALGERDCSPQRRHQKLLEETPPPGIHPAILADMRQAACRLGQSVHYASAGTVEFIYDVRKQTFFFLEMNTRLQVEHCVTESVTGLDLVEWMLGQAANTAAFHTAFAKGAPVAQGCALQARIYAEDTGRGFRPSTGLLTHVAFPASCRVESWIAAGTEVTPYYDPLLAKIIVHGTDRAEALGQMQMALSQTRIAGIETNIAYLAQILQLPAYQEGTFTTSTLANVSSIDAGIEVLSGGTLTTVQDLPGRLGYWAVGIPPSGPMDARSFRFANAVLGNPPETAALELTLTGPTLRFSAACTICLAGARMLAELDGVPVPWGSAIDVRAGAVLRMGALAGAGARAYLAIQGGFDVPRYLGSHGTFTLGGFGGHGGRALATGDILHRARATHTVSTPPDTIPAFTNTWDIDVLEGPHAAPDFFTQAGLAAFYAAEWEVHYNSNRTGVRLIGPKPGWARADGGEAGLHPSNIHDTAYAIGSIDFTGDMPVILGPDGPSLGGFVCPCTVTSQDLWKIGQLAPGDRIRFRPQGQGGAVMHHTPATPDRPCVTYRRAGDANLLVEYGPLVLDLELRLRAHALMQHLRDHEPPGIIDITPGIRSLQIHVDPAVLTLERLLAWLIAAEPNLPDLATMEVASRIVHLPLCWNDPSVQSAIARYAQSVRPDAPWCPSNIEFIRRINGLADEDEVKRIVFDASYLVLGLGDVYLGAPAATPIDPRHRLVTTKYNPARTWTPENAVGIGGAYMCIYGMESPGGYQLIGRTCQVWNTYRSTPDFAPGTSWLLRFFDQIRFYEVSETELDTFRADFAHGRCQLRTENTVFSLPEYRAFLRENSASIDQAKARQQAAFDAERARWATSDLRDETTGHAPSLEAGEAALAAGQVAVNAPVAGSVWRSPFAHGAPVRQGDTLVVIESMKTEIAVLAPEDGAIAMIAAQEGQIIKAGQRLAVIQTAKASAPA